MSKLLEDVLLTCARVRLDAAQHTRLAVALRQFHDWDRLLALADYHAISPLLARHLQEHASLVPERVFRQLQAECHPSATGNLALAGELLRLLDGCEQQGLQVVPFKGPMLALYAYGDLGLRVFFDLDLLVRPGDYQRIRAFLLARGYRLQLSLDPPWEQAYLRTYGQMPFEHSERGTLVEVHTAFTPRDFCFPLRLSEIWPGLVTREMLGRKVLQPADEDLLLLLAVHGAKHCWTGLGWICDVAELLRARPNMDWEALERRAIRTRSRRLLLLGLYLAWQFVQAPIPQFLKERIQCDPAVMQLGRETHGQLLKVATRKPDGLESTWYFFRAREALRDGARFFLSTLVFPTFGKDEIPALPPGLAFLHVLKRGTNLLRRYSRQFLRSHGPVLPTTQNAGSR